jgi:broad specificity phosphatase PhoE
MSRGSPRDAGGLRDGDRRRAVTERRLVLVRHGVTDWNREGRFQGHLDPGLADAGRHEAELVATRIAADDGLRPARLVSSSLGRAVETAAAIARMTGVAVEPDPRLMEIGQGEWEGRTHAELEVTDPDGTAPGAMPPACGSRPAARRSRPRRIASARSWPTSTVRGPSAW